MEMMPASDELSRLIALEQAMDRAHVTARSREISRHTGVSWSGVTPSAATTREPEVLDADARRKLAALRTWRATTAGLVLAAVAEAQRAAAAAHAAGEAARAAVSRGESDQLDGCILATCEMAERALAASQAARRACRIAEGRERSDDGATETST